MKITSAHLPRRVGAGLAAAGAAVLLAGCGLHNPNTVSLGSPASTPASSSTTTTSAPTATAAASPKSAPAPAGSATPQAAIERYAALWCDWTTADLHAHEHQLEAMSVGGARAQEQLALAAPTQPGGTTNVTNTCTIESLAQGRGDAAGKWVLVTASHSSTPNLPALPAQYHVTYITLATAGQRYVVNSWQPQS